MVELLKRLKYVQSVKHPEAQKVATAVAVNIANMANDIATVSTGNIMDEKEQGRIKDFMFKWQRKIEVVQKEEKNPKFQDIIGKLVRQVRYISNTLRTQDYPNNIEVIHALDEAFGAFLAELRNFKE